MRIPLIWLWNKTEVIYVIFIDSYKKRKEKRMCKKGRLVSVFIFHLLAVLLIFQTVAAQSEFSSKIQELADKLTSSTSGKVIDVRGDVIYVNLGEKDSVSEGSVFEVIRLGDPLEIDGKLYYEEKPVGKIQIIKVREDMSLANAIAALTPIQKGDKVYQQDRISPQGASGQKTADRGLIGLSGVDLKSVHRRLENGGFVPGPFNENNLAPLSEAIRRFQKFANLNVTGELDEITWSKLKILYDPQESKSQKTTHSYNASAKLPGAVRVNKIALMEFPHGKYFNDFTKNVYESLSVYFIRKGFQVVERSQLNRILAEQKISYSGLVDVATAQKLGKLLGSEVALLGTISDMGNDAIIRARLVDVEKGVSMAAAQVEMRKTPEIIKMIAGNSRSGGSSSGGGAMISPSSVEPDLPAKGFPIVKKDKGFTFSLEKCEMSGKELTIHFLITSHDRDRGLTLHNHCKSSDRYSRIFDNEGIEYWASNVFLAGKKADDCDVYSLLISDVVTKASLHFENISSKATKITRFDLNCWEGVGKSKFRLEFRNIPITKIK
jgi:TolB-like protein